jgi:hypothetical protein
VSAGSASGTLNLLTTGPVTAQASLSNPTGLSPLAKRRKTTLATGTPLLYITITSTGSSAVLSAASGSFTLAQSPTASVYLAYWTGSEWDTVSDTAATVSGTAVSFTYAFSPAIVANPSAYFALYETMSSPLPMASASPSPSPSSSAAAFVDTACYQSAAASQSGTLAPVTNFFTSVIPNGKTICISVWDISSDITSALVTAAKAGANVTVIMPYSEYSDDESSVPTLTAAGARIKWEYTTSTAPGSPTSTVTYEKAPMDIHAKFALVDGVAYMDGHNFFTTDVVMQDGILADFNAIQADLESFPNPAAEPSPADSFTTDKQLSLLNESTYLQQTAIPALAGGTATEYDFITESYNPTSSSGDYNDDVYGGMCQIASIVPHVTMNVILEDYSTDSSAVKSAMTNLLVLDPNAHVYSTSSGQEKISMVRSSIGGTVTSAWFGSSNSTTTDLFDWGIDIPSNNTAMLSALGTYFGTASPASGVLGGASPIASPAAGTTPQPCPSIHP